MGQKSCFYYRRNFVTSGPGIAGCDCIMPFLERVFPLLDAPSHLCKRVCPFVCPSVHNAFSQTTARRILCRVFGLVFTFSIIFFVTNFSLHLILCTMMVNLHQFSLPSQFF